MKVASVVAIDCCGKVRAGAWEEEAGDKRTWSINESIALLSRTMTLQYPEVCGKSIHTYSSLYSYRVMLQGLL